MPPVYDTYAAVRRLVEAGIPEPQAVAIVSEQVRFVENLATKEDLDQRLSTLMANVRIEIKAAESRTTNRIIGAMGVAVGLLGTLMTLLKVF